ncbi:MAG TPA: DUF5667 domain-containing protein [Anaerolineae bacterium]|nr:DUF5667 domain-containing protein [Anaerolineae bacterium]
MNPNNPDIMLQDYLDRHAAGEPVDALLAALRREPGGESLAVDLLLSLAMAQQLPQALRPARRAAMQTALQAAFVADRGAQARGLAAWLAPVNRRRLALRLGGVMLAGTLALGGGVVASAESLPGDAFYPVKRAVESARLAFTWSPEARARVWLDISDIRHQEVQDLDRQGRQAPSSLLNAWLTAHQQARQEAQDSGDPQLIQLVEEHVAAHSQDLESLPQPEAPQALQRLREEPTASPTDALAGLPTQAATDSPTPEPATATLVVGGSSGISEPRPTPGQGQTPWPPGRPRDRWRTATVPAATVEAWATERARRQTEEPRHRDDPTRDPQRRATDDARRATETARRATERASREGPRQPQDTPAPPAATPRPEQTPLIGPTNGPPPGPPRPTRRPWPTPDPNSTPERRCPPDCPPRTPRPPRPGEPPTVAPDPSEEPLPTSLSGVEATPLPPTPEQAVRP